MKFFVLLFLLFSTPVFADVSCPEFFVKGQEPVTTNHKLDEKTQQLCFGEFSLLHSGVTRTPLWSAEHLTGEHIEAGQGISRQNSFHAEEQLPEEDRAILQDYRRSGYDRGHMSPNGDMSSAETKEETFTLANMVPQSPCNNEVIWEGIESGVRSLAKEIGDVYVVTGPAFIGDELNSLKGRVMVPTHIWKAVYVPSRNEAMAYWTPNDNSLSWEIITLDELQKKIGIDVFPGLDAKIKTMAGTLPAPEAPHHKCRVFNR